MEQDGLEAEISLNFNFYATNKVSTKNIKWLVSLQYLPFGLDVFNITFISSGTSK